MLRTMVVVAVIVGGCDDTKPDHAAAKPVKIEAPAAASVPVGPPIEVTGGKLFEDYAKNRDAADALYLHKPLRVHCIVGSGHGSTSLDIEAAGGASHIEAWFPEGSASVLRSLKHYDEVFLRCTGGGMTDVPWLNDCSLERVVK